MTLQPEVADLGQVGMAAEDDAGIGACEPLDRDRRVEVLVEARPSASPARHGRRGRACRHRSGMRRSEGSRRSQSSRRRRGRRAPIRRPPRSRRARRRSSTGRQPHSRSRRPRYRCCRTITRRRLRGSRRASTTAAGSGPLSTRSPATSDPVGLLAVTSARTASRAAVLPWTSESAAIRVIGACLRAG